MGHITEIGNILVNLQHFSMAGKICNARRSPVLLVSMVFDHFAPSASGQLDRGEHAFGLALELGEVVLAGAGVGDQVELCVADGVERQPLVPGPATGRRLTLKRSPGREPG